MNSGGTNHHEPGVVSKDEFHPEDFEILAVDDNLDNLKVLRAILKDAGYRSRISRSGKEAITSCRSRLPDLILLDVNMPEMDGFEVMRRLSDWPGMEFVPVIFVSASLEGPNKLEAFSLGAVDYITKPYNSHELLARVRSTLTVCTLRKQLSFEVTKVQTILKSAADGILITDAAGNVESCNVRASHILGMNDSTLLGSHLGLIMPDLVLPTIDSPGGRSAQDLTYETRDGTERYISVSSSIAVVGSTTKVTVILHDLTDKKKLESELEVANRLQAIGRLSAGIAHEINTPLQAVRNNLRFIESVLSDLMDAPPSLSIADPDQQEIVSEAISAVVDSLDGVETAASSISVMRDFSEIKEGNNQVVDLPRLVQAARHLLKGEWTKVAVVDITFAPDVPVLHGNPGAFQQMVLNLMMNGIEAVEAHKGKHGHKLGKIDVRIELESDCVVLSVQDDGIGMEREVLHKCRDLFFTTKGLGEGSGQGLPQVHQLAVERGGRLEIESSPGQGTLVRVSFPAEAKSAAA